MRTITYLKCEYHKYCDKKVEKDDWKSKGWEQIDRGEAYYGGPHMYAYICKEHSKIIADEKEKAKIEKRIGQRQADQRYREYLLKKDIFDRLKSLEKNRKLSKTKIDMLEKYSKLLYFAPPKKIPKTFMATVYSCRSDNCSQRLSEEDKKRAIDLGWFILPSFGNLCNKHNHQDVVHTRLDFGSTMNDLKKVWSSKYTCYFCQTEIAYSDQTKDYTHWEIVKRLGGEPNFIIKKCVCEKCIKKEKIQGYKSGELKLSNGNKIPWDITKIEPSRCKCDICLKGSNFEKANKNNSGWLIHSGYVQKSERVFKHVVRKAICKTCLTKIKQKPYLLYNLIGY